MQIDRMVEEMVFKRGKLPANYEAPVAPTVDAHTGFIKQAGSNLEPVIATWAQQMV